MLFLNDKEQIIKYKDEMLKINPQITEMVAKYAGCSVEEVERCVEKYFLLLLRLHLPLMN